jgi:phospholipid/cholesterol/gamma-HCH transport system substrate-binding protein
LKISNETKVGALTAIAITLLLIGYNYLKGNNFLAPRGEKIYALFDNVGSLEVSNPVFVKGLQVGTVHDKQAFDKNVSKIVVTINLSKEVNIPDNSVAVISNNPLGTSSIEINFGNSGKYITDGDTLNTKTSESLMTMIKGTLDPTLSRLNHSLESIDSTVKRVGNVFNAATQQNLQQLIANLKLTSDELVTVSASIKTMTDPENGSLAKSLKHVEKLTDSVSSRSGAIAKSMDNVEKITAGLARADIESTIRQLRTATEKLSAILEKIDKAEGSMGLLVNDKKLYNELASAIYNYKMLAQDLRVHPKRYVSLSVFGKKDKGGYLTAPLPDSMQNDQKK